MLNIPDEPIPRDAHFNMGKVERRTQSIKWLAYRIQSEVGPRLSGPGGAFQALIEANGALNRASGDHGFSPEQQLIGRARRLPGDLSTIPELWQMRIQVAALEDDGFRLRLEVREAAEKAKAQMDNNLVIRRGLLAGPPAVLVL